MQNIKIDNGSKGKKMYQKYWIAALLTLSSISFSSFAQAVTHPYEFHADARMAHFAEGPIDRAYGFLSVSTNARGNGMINVMFANGNQHNKASFNARVKFLNGAGRIIKVEHFESWIDAAGYDEVIERRVLKPLSVSAFESIEVEFYLSDASDLHSGDS